MHRLSLLASEVHVCMHAGNTFCGHRANSIPSNLIASRIIWLRADAIRFSVQTDNYTAAFEYNYTCSPMTRQYCLVSSLQCGTRLVMALCVGANEVFHFCWAIEDDKEFKSLAALSSQLPSALLLWCVRVHVHMYNVMYVASFTYIVYYTCTCTVYACTCTCTCTCMCIPSSTLTSRLPPAHMHMPSTVLLRT